MNSFGKWLQVEENREEKAEMLVAAFLEDMVEKAATLMKQNAGPFDKVLRQVWPHNNMHFPADFPPEVASHPVEIRAVDPKIRSAVEHDPMGNFSAFIINSTPFNTQNPEERDAAVEALISAIHHEAEHIHHPGTSYDVSDDMDEETKQRASRKYMHHEGEIRAHAREIARAYVKKFPDTPFILDKARSLMASPHFNQTHKNYMDENYGYAHMRIIKYIQQFMPQYVSKSSYL
jgi:hypothetical protein